ncbi:MAG TPA: hypothetical protein VG496_02610 [Myxococcales bacterium]|nr:hypothetical protein [Myxococcales bacterium]
MPGSGLLKSRTAPIIGLCLFAGATISWVRDWIAGTIGLDDHHLALVHRIWPFVLFGCFAALAGHLYLKALRRKNGPSRHLLAGAIVIQLLAAPALPLTSEDLFSYVSYARVMHGGRNPYRAVPAELGENDPAVALMTPRWRHNPMLYGPLTAWATAAVAPLDTLAGAVAAFKLEMLILALAAVLLAYGFSRSCLPPGQSDAAFVFFGWNPLLAWEVAGQAHTEGLVLVAMLVFVWAAMREREWLAALALACAVCAKVVLLPLLGLYLCFILRRRPLRAIAIGAACGALGVVLMLPFWQGGGTVRSPMKALVADPTLTARSLTDMVVWLLRPLGDQVTRNVYWVALALGTLLLGSFGMRAVLRARSLRQVLRDGLVFFLLYDLIAAPWFQSWYMLWVLPLALADEDERWRTLVAVYSVLLLVQYGIPLDPVTYLVINLLVLRMLWKMWPITPPVSLPGSGWAGPPVSRI